MHRPRRLKRTLVALVLGLAVCTDIAAGCAGVRARNDARESHARLERLLTDVRARARSSSTASSPGFRRPEYVEVDDRVLCVAPIASEASLFTADVARARAVESWSAVETAVARGDVSDAGCGHDPRILLERFMLVTVRTITLDEVVFDVVEAGIVLETPGDVAMMCFGSPFLDVQDGGAGVWEIRVRRDGSIVAQSHGEA